MTQIQQAEKWFDTKSQRSRDPFLSLSALCFYLSSGFLRRFSFLRPNTLNDATQSLRWE